MRYDRAILVGYALFFAVMLFVVVELASVHP